MDLAKIQKKIIIVFFTLSKAQKITPTFEISTSLFCFQFCLKNISVALLCKIFSNKTDEQTPFVNRMWEGCRDRPNDGVIVLQLLTDVTHKHQRCDI